MLFHTSYHTVYCPDLALESASLLALCLKKIAGLDKPGVKVLDAVWVWTESHSKRCRCSALCIPLIHIN